MLNILTTRYNKKNVQKTTEEEADADDLLFCMCISDLLGRLPLAADGRHDCAVLLELGEYLVHLLAVKSGKGGHFTGRHRLACAAHSLENLCCCLFHCLYGLIDVVVSVFRSDVPKCPETFDIVGIEVLRLSSSEKTALPADRAVAETLELVSYEFKSLLSGRGLYIRSLHNIKVISSNKDNILIRESVHCI